MMTLRQYIEKCMQNKQFAYYWEMDNLQLPEDGAEDVEEVPMTDDEIDDLMEALNITIDDVIKNHGVESTKGLDIVIKFYEIDSKCPVAEFLDEMSDQKLKEKTVKSIMQLSDLGKNARPPLSEYVGDGIYELRTKQSSNISRIFFYFIHGNDIIMTNGYIKKSQKMDSREFKRAKQYRDEYSRRFN